MRTLMMVLTVVSLAALAGFPLPFWWFLASRSYADLHGYGLPYYILLMCIFAGSVAITLLLLVTAWDILMRGL
jgi:hypothetical protein